MTRLPVPGGDNGDWGSILNAFLEVAHGPDGSLLPTALVTAGGITSVNGQAPSSGDVTLTATDVGAYSKPINGIPASDLDSTTQAALAAAAISPVIASFSMSGLLSVASGTSRFYNDTGSTLTIQIVRTSVGTTPSGASVIIDINLNGASIFSSQASQPTIAASANTATANIFVTGSWPSGSYLSVDIDQVGSTMAGADLSVQVVAN